MRSFHLKDPTVIFAIFYVIVNVLGLIPNVHSVVELGQRAGTLGVLNMGPLFAGPSLSFLSDLIGLSRAALTTAHRVAAIMMFCLGTFHAVVAIVTRLQLLSWSGQNVWGAMGASITAGLLCSAFLLRRRLRILWTTLHQAAALLLTYALFRHVSPGLLLPRTFIPAALALYLVIMVLYGAIVASRNCHDNKCTVTFRRATHGDALVLSLSSRQPLTTGQYTTMWIPRPGSRLSLDCFTIIAYADRKTNRIDIPVNPSHRLTQALRPSELTRAVERRALLSPHGRCGPMATADRLLFVATGPHIVSHLPYLNYLSSQKSEEHAIHVDRVHLVWIMPTYVSEHSPMARYLSHLFSMSQHGRKIRVSIYLGDSNSYTCEIVPGIGDATLQDGYPDLKLIIEQESTPREWEDSVATLVATSAQDREYNRVRRLVRELAKTNVQLVTLAEDRHQPETVPEGPNEGFWLE